MQRDTVGKTLLVATLLCVVCASIVSGVAVSLRDRQELNKQQELQSKILEAAGVLDASRPVPEQFADVEIRLVDLDSGDLVPESEIDPVSYDQRGASVDPAKSISIPSDLDLAGIKRREKYAKVYLFRDAGGAIETYVFPVNGKGLWSTLYGMLAVEPDLTTVKGLIFYEHKETPGLGGEVDNPLWKAQWAGKIVFDDGGKVRAEVIKGNVDPSSSNARYQVDGLTGATITSRGVTNLLRYWMGEHAFGPFIERVREGGLNLG